LTLFERSGKRWEANYDPKMRELSYKRLRRRESVKPSYEPT